MDYKKFSYYKYIINLQEWQNQAKLIISYHKDASHCCARVAAADWFTCRLVLKVLTTGKNGVVVERMHQIRVHIPKEKTNLLYEGNRGKKIRAQLKIEQNQI